MVSDIDNCLKQIEKVKRVAEGEDVAYVARSRLGRLTLSLTTLVCRNLGVPILDRPNQLSVRGSASEDTWEFIRACNRLNQIAKTIAQPSEPLDERWRSGWSSLLCELDWLKLQLQSMKDRSQTMHCNGRHVENG